jgi:hypothetical protein
MSAPALARIPTLARASMLAEIETRLGETLIAAELTRYEIESLRYAAERDVRSQTLALFACAILAGLVIGVRLAFVTLK